MRVVLARGDNLWHVGKEVGDPGDGVMTLQLAELNLAEARNETRGCAQSNAPLRDLKGAAMDSVRHAVALSLTNAWKSIQRPNVAQSARYGANVPMGL